MTGGQPGTGEFEGGFPHSKRRPIFLPTDSAESAAGLFWCDRLARSAK